VVKSHFVIGLIRTNPATSDINIEKVLNWSCTIWGEWQVANDGTCRDIIKPRGFPTAIGRVKYRDGNYTCGTLE